MPDWMDSPYALNNVATHLASPEQSLAVPAHLEEEGRIQLKEIRGFRFSEEKQEGGSAVKIVRAWASSVFQEEGRKFSAGNVASDDEGYWCSIGGHSAEETVTLEIELEKPSRVQDILVKYAYSPKDYSVQVQSSSSQPTLR